MRILFISILFFIFSGCQDITNNTAKNEGVKTYGVRQIIKTGQYTVDLINVDGKLYLIGYTNTGNAISIISK